MPQNAGQWPDPPPTLVRQSISLEGSIWMSIMFAGVDRAIKTVDAKRHNDIVEAVEAGD
ncbi:hypothetical protein [Mycolicibacterium sp. CH28]|uniref:hypothetical protein n=1 Tax=Mycolicibacterium sp. CH28 TaxID=2512237 RepID=UPI0019135192|nr:hypothetical protein [Mycolicibacterium sp. CH28]